MAQVKSNLQTQTVSLREVLTAGQEAVLAARQRTGCRWIGTVAAPGYQVGVVLVIYRPAGSSIIIEMHKPVNWEHARTYLSMVRREEIIRAVEQEATRLENEQARSSALRATSRKLKDAAILRAAVAELNAQDNGAGI